MADAPLSSDLLLEERMDPGVLWLRISRPAVLNALNTATLVALEKRLHEISKDESIRVLVLSGAGDKAFVAGADIAEMQNKTPSEGVAFAQLGHSVARLLETMGKPTLAAVNGYALGGGTELALACDFIVASERAQFGQPEVGIGIIPGFGATFRLAKFVGIPRAKELIFTGRRVMASEALSLGLVNAVYPVAEFEDKVRELAVQIAKQSASAVGRSKQLINELGELSGLNAKVDAEAHAFGMLFGSPDQREGMGAFVEKRKPAFAGLMSAGANGAKGPGSSV
jgi:enoyl-CoA hydratase